MGAIRALCYLTNSKGKDETVYIWNNYSQNIEPEVRCPEGVCFYLHFNAKYLFIKFSTCLIKSLVIPSPPPPPGGNYSAIGTRGLSAASNSARIALYAVWPFFFAVSTTECKSRKASAPLSERNVPEFFILILTFLIPLSLALLSGGMAGFSRKLKM